MATPRYKDIAAKIGKRIEDGEWEPGAKLPTLDTFAAEYDVNRNTIHRAIEDLEVDGYVMASQGRNVLVRYNARPRRSRGQKVKRNLHLRGYSFPSASAGEVWMKHGDADNSPAAINNQRIADMLGVPVGTVVPRRFRVTGPVGEPPFQINISWIHPRGEHLVANVDANPAAGEWLYRLEVGGHWPIAWEEIHRARRATREEAALLEIPTSLPVLEIVRIGRSGSDGKPIEVTEYILASDRVETRTVLIREDNATDPWPDLEDDQ